MYAWCDAPNYGYSLGRLTTHMPKDAENSGGGLHKSFPKNVFVKKVIWGKT